MKHILQIVEKLLGGFITLSLALLIVPQFIPVHAQQFAVTLKPAQNHIIAKPGATIVLPYTLTNTGDPSVVKMQVYLLSVKDTTGAYELIPYNSDVPDFPQFTTSDAALKINEPFLVSSQEAVEFDLMMVTHENLKEGDYYFTFVIESEPTQGFEDTSHIILQSGIGSNIYLSVSKDGVLQQSGEITQFDVQPQYTVKIGERRYSFFDSFQPIPILLTVVNKGKHILKTSGTLSIHSTLSSEATVIPIHEQYVLANTQRLLAGTSNENIQSSDTNTVLLPGSFIGAYTAQSILQIGNDKEQQNVSFHYYVFPIRYSILLLFTVLASFAVRSLRRFIKK